MNTLQTLFPTPMLNPELREGTKRSNRFNPGSDLGISDEPQLTVRQREVLQLIAEGKANKEAAAELCISVKTVEKHRGNLMEKLGIHGTASLTRYAIAAGII